MLAGCSHNTLREDSAKSPGTNSALTSTGCLNSHSDPMLLMQRDVSTPQLIWRENFALQTTVRRLQLCTCYYKVVKTSPFACSATCLWRHSLRCEVFRPCLQMNSVQLQQLSIYFRDPLAPVPHLTLNWICSYPGTNFFLAIARCKGICSYEMSSACISSTLLQKLIRNPDKSK